MTVFTLSWATGFNIGVGFLHSCSSVFVRFFIPVSALIARIGVENAFYATNMNAFYFFFFLNSGSPVLVDFVPRGMNVFDGVTFLGTFLSELFPTNIRYLGTSLIFNKLIGAALCL
jgi:hypothetical protein